MTKVHSVHSLFVMFLAWVIPMIIASEGDVAEAINSHWGQWQAWSLAVVIGGVHYVYQRVVSYLTALEDK